MPRSARTKPLPPTDPDPLPTPTRSRRQTPTPAPMVYQPYRPVRVPTPVYSRPIPHLTATQVQVNAMDPFIKNEFTVHFNQPSILAAFRRRPELNRYIEYLDNGVTRNAVPNPIREGSIFLNRIARNHQLNAFVNHMYEFYNDGALRRKRDEERRVERLKAEEGLRYLERRVPIGRRTMTVHDVPPVPSEHDGRPTSKRRRTAHHVEKNGLGFELANHMRGFIGGSRKRRSTRRYR